MDDVLRLGFVGVGMAVTRIFSEKPGITKLPYVKITGAADPRSHALEVFKKEFNAETYNNIEDLCKSPNVDAVYIATPPEMHAEHTLVAAKNGKHVIVEKPMALSIDDAERMNDTADKYKIKLLCGHTHSFDAPVRKMREIVRSGELGPLRMINTWNYNEFMYRPWPSHELVTSNGLIFNQTPHQVDVVRLIGGGKVNSVRAWTGAWDSLRPGTGAYSCFMEFDDGVPATLVYNGYGFFDTAELMWWTGEGGQPRDPDTNLKMRTNLRRIAGSNSDKVLEEQKEQMRYGQKSDKWPEIWEIWGAGHDAPVHHQSFFGLTVVSCEKGDMRQSQDGILIYGEDQKKEISLEQVMRGRQAEVTELYEAVMKNRPVSHDGRWGEATLEVCLAIVESGKTGKELKMSHQVASWE